MTQTSTVTHSPPPIRADDDGNIYQGEHLIATCIDEDREVRVVTAQAFEECYNSHAAFTARVAELEALVERAFREGYRHGNYSGSGGASGHDQTLGEDMAWAAHGHALIAKGA